MCRYQIDCLLTYFLKLALRFIVLFSLFVPIVLIVQSENSPQALVRNHQKRKMGIQKRNQGGLLPCLYLVEVKPVSRQSGNFPRKGVL